MRRGRGLEIGVGDVRRNDNSFTPGGSFIHRSFLPLIRRLDPVILFRVVKILVM